MKSNPRAPVPGLIANYIDGETVADVAFMFDGDVAEMRQLADYYVAHVQAAILAAAEAPPARSFTTTPEMTDAEIDRLLSGRREAGR